MAILYGTTGDGTTLPVLVDQFGNLLAKGIDGPEGPPGPPGADGGSFPLPPDPAEGALLGWEDGELAWIGGAISLPASTYGPFTYQPNEQVLYIPQNASALLTGQKLFMSNEKGEIATSSFQTDTIASVNKVNGYDYISHCTGSDAFGGSWSSVWTSPLNTSDPNAFLPTKGVECAWTRQSNQRLPIKNKLSLWLTVDGNWASSGGYLKINGEWQSLTASQPNAQEYEFYDFTSLDSIQIQSGTGSANFAIRFYGVAIDDEMVFQNIYPQLSVLTFPTSNNFYKFEVGDVVQDPDVEIYSIRPGTTPPTIEVGGGSWLGTDGSGDAEGQTVLATPPLSGSGTVAIGFDQAILLRESNQEWVDGFYVTAQENRVAARKVLANAKRRATK